MKKKKYKYYRYVYNTQTKTDIYRVDENNACWWHDGKKWCRSNLDWDHHDEKSNTELTEKEVFMELL